jgi:hypothetical protein
MNLQGNETEPSTWASSDAYTQVLSAIESAETQSISVPQLSRFLGIKTTTLNARFRRHETALRTVGRTNFISRELALELAELHRYALIGWPTLKQASRLTGVKAGTIKARCEKGRLEGYVDLTKRLRINPAELDNIRRCPASEESFGNGKPRSRSRAEPPARRLVRPSVPPDVRGSSPLAAHANGSAPDIATERAPFVPRPLPEPEIKIVTGKDYGLPDAEEMNGVEQPTGRKNKEKLAGRLDYDPDRPFSVSACAVGQSITYGPNDGTIIRIINDPFSPKILVHFPHHQHPLMREVLLSVEKRKNSAAA